MKRKLLCCLLAALLCVCLFGCAGQPAASASLYDRGLSLVALMDEALQSEEYLELYTASAPIREKVAGAGVHTDLEKVYAVTLPEETLALLTAELPALSEASVSLQKMVKDRVFSSLMNLINARGGAETLAAANVCTMSSAFAGDGTQQVLYLYVYADGCPVAVTFLPGEEGAVSATCTPVLYAEFACETAEEIVSSFEELGLAVTIDIVE